MKLDICLNKNKNKDFSSYDFIYFVWNQLLTTDLKLLTIMYITVFYRNYS